MRRFSFVILAVAVAGCGSESTIDGDAGGDRDAGPRSDGAAAPDAPDTPDGAAGDGMAPADGGMSPPPAYPADLLDLTDWKLTLPVETDHAGSPDEIRQPELATFSLAPYFVPNGEGTAVVFRAHAGGATTDGSGYPRSELREMTGMGADEASWSTTSGTHVMTIRQAITALPPVKPHVVAGQIHDAADDVVMIRLEDRHLFVEGGGADLGTLDPDYELGTIFTTRIEASGGFIRVHHDGALRVEIERRGDGMYFKAGCYTQSNESRGDAPEAYGEVVIYALEVSHL